MHLKVFAVPAMVIAILVISIGHIRPAVGQLDEKRQQLEAKIAELENLETIASNVESLNGSLDSRSSTEDFVRRYLPQEMDQERAVDSFNFLAARSGLSIVDMEFSDMTVVSAAVMEEAPLGETPVIPAFVPPTPKRYAASVEVRGAYENIRVFFDRLARSDRVKRITLLEVAKDDDRAMPAEGEEPSVGALVGTFSAEFDYLPPRAAAAGVATPAFQKSQFDMSDVDMAMSLMSDPVPPLEVSAAGRANPFQR